MDETSEVPFPDGRVLLRDSTITTGYAASHRLAREAGPGRAARERHQGRARYRRNIPVVLGASYKVVVVVLGLSGARTAWPNRRSQVQITPGVPA